MIYVIAEDELISLTRTDLFWRTGRGIDHLFRTGLVEDILLKEEPLEWSKQE